MNTDFNHPAMQQPTPTICRSCDEPLGESMHQFFCTECAQIDSTKDHCCECHQPHDEYAALTQADAQRPDLFKDWSFYDQDGRYHRHCSECVRERVYNEDMS